jgi:stage III sporulation protein SpoIIIAA
MSRTLSRDEARAMSMKARNLAASQIVVVAMQEEIAVADPLYRIAARLLAYDDPSAPPSGFEAASWEA